MYSLTSLIITTVTIPLLYFTWSIIYNLHFHPLAKYPGPKFWGLSRVPYVLAMQNGTLVHRITEIHNQYGTIVRVAPNELSFIDAAACRDIYAVRAGQPRFPKNPIWMGEPIPRGNSIVDASDEDHARIRKVWGHAFTEKALRLQEPVLQMYVSKFITRMREVEVSGPLDIVQWLNFLTFDLTGDLAFGESFGCLEGRTLHPWISMIFAHFKSATLLASIRFYPSLYRVLIWSLPASVLRKQRDHFKMASEKVQHRLNLDTERTDFLQHVVEYDGGGRAVTLSKEEIEKTAATMIVAGSETTGTLLSGILNFLLRHPDVMDQLVNEVRSAFPSEHAASLASLADLPYLGAVIQEGLRIAPPVPTGMPRVVPHGGAHVNGHWLPENTFVSYAQYAAYHSPLNFSSPEEFLPARWLLSNQDSHLETSNPDALQPFSMGPRSCIGQKLAWAETRLVLARFLWQFDIEGVDVREWAEQKTFTLWEKVPLWIRLKSRTDV